MARMREARMARKVAALSQRDEKTKARMAQAARRNAVFVGPCPLCGLRVVGSIGKLGIHVNKCAKKQRDA